MPERFENSVATWVDKVDQAKVSGSVAAAAPGGATTRLRSFVDRQRARGRHADEVYAASRYPKHGLPVTQNGAVVEFVGGLIKQRKPLAAGLLAFNVVAAVAGLLVPTLLGTLIDRITEQAARTDLAEVTRIGIMIIVIVVLQGGFTMVARRCSVLFGQGMVSQAREHIIRIILRLPLSRVETASTGDLVTRVTRDVGAMAGSVRWALPQFVIAAVTAVLTLGMIVVNSWFLGLPIILTLLVIAAATKRYLRQATPGYVTEGMAYGAINSSLTETVEGARSIEALGLGPRRVALTDADIDEAAEAETYTMLLRAQLWLQTNLAYQVPIVIVILLGTAGLSHGWVTLGQITAATMYLQQVASPFERMIGTLNMMQIGMASTTRLLGIAAVPQDRETTDEEPAGPHLHGADLSFAYRANHDVLHHIDLDLRDGERLAIVGPSGSGKSTLGRLLAGINAPRTGVVTVGGVDIMHLALPVLRTEVALVTQEHHVFVGSIRDNIVLAREDTTTDDEVWAALRTVEADTWVERLDDGIATMVGSGNLTLTPAQAQQIALARLVIADPHTLVLDEATSLIDPTTARHVEGSMSALLTGRTVVAIAHRLHTAHDAQRIAVVIDGRITELGSHEELMALGGEYARLWRAWTR